ncbi:lipopolysaccharide biosynthesis protein [Acinetobacter sp. YH16042]|uniref:lipopolysaccharide biosynthesis protein n=1 Tax=Acinetobacter sp. YH16042 TaxID=2601186 RepID=UPI0015D126AB|nr:oligosaccharide flippase family protein [Acinetobacter sp. YH16042]
MSFLKKTIKFGSGVILAQLITAASIPLLSRLYKPEEFSLFGMYFSIAAILMVFVTLKLENTLPKEKNIEDKIPIILNVGYLTFVPLCLFCGFILYIINDEFDSGDIYWSILIVFAAYTFNIFNILNILNIRENKISLSNKARVLRSVFSIVFQIIFIFLKGGLFIGETLGRFLGLVFLSRKKYYYLKLHESMDLIKNQINYIKYVMTASFLNTLGLNLYPIVIMKFYDPILVGKFFFVQKILSAPVTIIAQSISVVMLGDFRKIIQTDKKELIKKLNKITFLFFIASIFLFITIGFLLKYSESFIFGQSWIGIYIYVFILLPFLVGQIAFSPFSQMLVLVGGEKFQVVWDMFRLILVIFSVAYPLLLEIENSFICCLLIYSIANFLLYLIHYIFLIKKIKVYCHE